MALDGITQELKRSEYGEPDKQTNFEDVFGIPELANILFKQLPTEELIKAVHAGATPDKKVIDIIKMERSTDIDYYFPEIEKTNPFADFHLDKVGYLLSVVLGGILAGLVCSTGLAPIFLLIPLIILVLSALTTVSDQKTESKYEENEKLRDTLKGLDITAVFEMEEEVHLVERPLVWVKDPQDTTDGPGELLGGNREFQYPILTVISKNGVWRSKPNSYTCVHLE